jgi:phosphate transport system substrate-binding protein
MIFSLDRSGRRVVFARTVQLAVGLRVLAATVLVATAAGATWASETIRIGGTGSGVGGLRLVAEAFARQAGAPAVEVLPAFGSAGGIAALVEGRLDIALTNRVPNAAELQRAAMKVQEYARTPFVMAVHRNLGLQALTGAQFAALYAEGAAAYPNGQRARPVLRLAEEIDSKLVSALVPAAGPAHDAARARKGMLRAATDAEAADLLEKVPGTFAASTLAQIESERRPFVALTIDGRAPTTAALASGQYPHFKPLYFIVRADAPARTARFVDFLLSDAGQAILAAHGHVPRRAFRP